MTQETTISSTEISFKDFLFKNKWNKTSLIIAFIAVIIQFSIFKYLYPYASYIHGDSFSYLNAAEKNLDINTYLIGYSKFLRLFSVFNRTDYTLTAFQYLFIQCSALYLIFSLFYFCKPGKVVQMFLLCFMIFNPLFLHLGNLISSDGFFLALSQIWFALLLWISFKPSLKIIFWHAIILFIAFTVRYNAIIYPIIAILAFIFSSMSWQKKILGFGMIILLLGSFIGFTMYKYKELTGVWQYSPFSGWQFANNAMYSYRYVDKPDRKLVPQKFQKLDNLIRLYFDSTKNKKNYIVERIQASTFYMWSPALPLMKYRNSLYKKDTTTIELKKWASMGPLYKEYGLYIIRQYPWHYARYFLWPNANKYYAPPIEFLESYNSGKTDVTKDAKKWFGYKSIKIKTRMKNNIVWVLDFYPIMSGIINTIMLFSLLCYLNLNKLGKNSLFKKSVALGASVWLINASFTIFASSAALRFQSFPIILTTIFVSFLIDWMVTLMISFKAESTLVENKVPTNAIA